jgi:hypothetical protein
MSWEDDIRKQLQSSGGELDAPGGGKYRLIGDNIWHYDAAEIAAEKEAQIKAQQDEERYKQAKSADSALADYYKNRQTADTVGQIDTSALSSLASAPKQPATPYDEAATRISLAGNADQAGDKTALDLLAKHQGPLQGLSEPVDLPAAPAADMAYQKTAAERYADIQNRLGGMVTGNNSPVDIALDRAQKAAEMEQAAKEKADAQKANQAFLADQNRQKLTADEQARQEHADLMRALADKKTGASGGFSPADITDDSPAMDIVDALGTGKLIYDQMIKIYPGFSKNAAKREAIVEKTMEKYPGWSPTESTLQYKAGSNAKAIQTITAGNNALSNMDDYINLSDQWKRTGSPAFNKLLAAGQIQVGDKVVSNLHQYNMAVGDEIAGVLGYGTASDLKTHLGLDMTDPNASPEVTKSNLLIARHMLMNRIKTQQAPMGQYGERAGLKPTVPDYGTVGGGAEQKFDAAQNQTKVINGVTYKKVAGGW